MQIISPENSLPRNRQKIEIIVLGCTTSMTILPKVKIHITSYGFSQYRS